ncbi:sodium/glutamate symporter [Arthrobacter castelli]|uniref:sodium/glutamate symporter n=1 Tax=Arthrobacter castelli TaxID=271431 RepID=UPI0003FA281E|nr:sodium/glutamate symporter [Arthrobacter castelli]
MNFELDLVQSSALALILLLLGEIARNRIGFLSRFSIPGPVIGGFFFALLALLLRQTGVAEIEFDTTLQTPAMVAFFSTIGLGGSLAMMKKGGKLLVVYLIACWTVAIMQNLIGIGMANAVGVDPMLGIMAGATSLEGGHGAAAAFGPTAEQMGTTGATEVAIAAATFGLVAGSLLGGPIAGWLMKRRRVTVPSEDKLKVGVLSGGGSAGADIAEDQGSTDEPEHAAGYRDMLAIAVMIGVIMVMGILLGDWFTDVTGFALPAYVGAMVIAVIFRNINDKLGWFKIDDRSVDLISKFTLGFFLTQAMMSLKIWELANLALPLIIILVVQVVFLILFAVFVVFRMMGRNYDSVTMVSGLIGHGLGATPNALANMDAFNSRFGVRSEKAFLIVPLAGAMLIDMVALPWIVWCMNWVA